MRRVSFNYGSKTVLNEINLSFDKHKSYAIVGESGSGKTTLLNIISGLYSQYSGEVLVDDQRLDDFHRESYQQKIGYITQEPVIFEGSVFENVTFWSEPTEENIEKCKNALQKALISDFINELDEGIFTRLGANGISLSGQRQRISIARELFKEVELLLMDEATSALDSETESMIQSNIENLRGDYTIIIIAHRLSTIRNMDTVILLGSSKVVMTGSFQELLDNSCQFRNMADLQEISN